MRFWFRSFKCTDVSYKILKRHCTWTDLFHCTYSKFFASWAEGLPFYHPGTGSIPMESTFAWVGNSISRDRHVEAVDRTGVGLFRSTVLKWGLRAWCPRRTAVRSRGHTADHILASCPLYHPPNVTLGLAALDDDTVDWHKKRTKNLMTRSAQTKKKIVHIHFKKHILDNTVPGYRRADRIINTRISCSGSLDSESSNPGPVKSSGFSNGSQPL